MPKTTSSKPSKRAAEPKRYRRTITMPPSNGRDTGGLLCDAVQRPKEVEFKSKDEIRAFVDEMRAKGKIVGPAPVPPKADPARPVKIGREGVATGLSSGSVCGVPQGVESKWVNVTPAMAGEWLRNNFSNRPVSEDTVDAYARDMSNGVWTRTHQGIAFNDRDELIDGQHRLMAVVKSGRTVPMMVTYGLPSQITGSRMTTMDAVDRGKTRSVADQLKIQHGMKNGSAIAMVVKSLAAICSSERTRRLSVGQTLEIYEEFRAQVDAVIASRPREHGMKSAGVLAGFAFAMAGGGEFEADAWEAFTSGNVKKGGALEKLRAFLTSDDAKLLMRSSDRALAELVLEALRLEREGRRIDALEHATVGADEYRRRQPERVAKVAEMFSIGGNAKVRDGGPVASGSTRDAIPPFSAPTG